MRRAPLLSMLFLAACSSVGTASVIDPPRLSEPIKPEVTSTTVPDTAQVEVLGYLLTTTTEATSTTTTTTTASAESPAPRTTTTTQPPAGTTTTTTAPQPAGTYSGEMESQFVAKINSLRGSAGVATLSRNSDLDAYARSWARQMGESGKLGHSGFGGLSGSWSAVGENVGYGGSVSTVFSALTNSSQHYETMTKPEFTNLGVGVWVDADGTLWTCHVFAG